jgi:cobalt/nickel transport system ATP-binding protein
MIAVEIKGLSYSYPDGHRALDSIDLAAGEGESVALVGSNGSGKTTLILHLNGILRGQGSVRVLGMEANGSDRGRIRAAVGVLFQDPDEMLFCPTVREDVEFGPRNLKLGKDEVESRTAGALGRVGLSSHGDRSPHHLSAGEKKRAALAAVLAMHPAILALDEPSADLDPRARRGLIGLISGFAGTRIVASHDLDLVRALCTRVVLLNTGRIAADGPAAAILEDGRLLEANGL